MTSLPPSFFVEPIHGFHRRHESAAERTGFLAVASDALGAGGGPAAVQEIEQIAQLAKRLGFAINTDRAIEAGTTSLDLAMAVLSVVVDRREGKGI